MDDIPAQRSYLYVDIANSIERMILSEKFNVGDKLPSENELSRSFAVSRNVVREALKSLKERGLIDIKTGKGAYVVVPRFDMFSALLNRINSMKKVPYNDLLDLRYVLETNAAGLAAERAGDDEVIKMEGFLKVMKDSASAAEWAFTDIQFHVAIAEATHNVLYSTIMCAISDLYIRSFVRTYFRDGVPSSIVKHRRILECIRAKDRAGAEEAARSLIETHSSQLHTVEDQTDL
jgi:DNA-binding FadR family transcriptional regulator